MRGVGTDHHAIVVAAEKTSLAAEPYMFLHIARTALAKSGLGLHGVELTAKLRVQYRGIRLGGVDDVAAAHGPAACFYYIVFALVGDIEDFRARVQIDMRGSDGRLQKRPDPFGGVKAGGAAREAGGVFDAHAAFFQYFRW